MLFSDAGMFERGHGDRRILAGAHMSCNLEGECCLTDRTTGSHRSFRQGREDWAMERSLEALEKLKSEISLGFVSNACHSFSLPEAIHLKHTLRSPPHPEV